MFAGSWDLGGLCVGVLAAPQEALGRKQLRRVGGDGERLNKGHGSLRAAQKGLDRIGGGALWSATFKRETERF